MFPSIGAKLVAGRRIGADRRRDRQSSIPVPQTIATPPPVSLEDVSGRPAGRSTQTAALAFLSTAFTIAFASLMFGARRGPEVVAFVPVAATLWSAAELLTAYMLFSQFTVNGIRTFLFLGAAYAVDGLLTIPYLANFPGVAGRAGGLGAEQISVVIWSVWHFTFPGIIACGMLCSRGVGARVLDAARIRRERAVAFVAVLVICATVTAVVIGLHDLLPILVVHGQFTAPFTGIVAPAIALTNVAAALLVLRLTPRLSAVHAWLAVALAAAALDAGLNALGGGRYSPSWYVGKVLTLTTASVVLIALLAEVWALYRRVGALAMNDSLTGLHNRRSFDEHAARLCDWCRRQHGEIAVLMIDVDRFKLYNDCYGHPAGDACLRRIGDALQTATRRGSDIIARYGGEEFVALLPQATRKDALEVAERLRRGVESLAIPHSGGIAGVVTISIGVGYTGDIVEGDPHDLLALADRALYAAKRQRNVVVAEMRSAASLSAA
jgi:diguanylate cyclase (GGDEF)-like protein